MELKIYDYDFYEKDIAAQRLHDFLKEKLSAMDGMWLYREPEIKTAGDDYPTFTIISSSFGVLFIRVYDYTADNLTQVESKYWTINGQNVKSELLRFRNYVHKIASKIEDPMIEFSDSIPINTVYVFPYFDNTSHFSNIGLKDRERLFVGDVNNINFFDDVYSPLSENDYRSLVSVIQNANIINKSSNVYVEEPAKNISEAIVLNNNRIAMFDYDQMEASLTITEKSERIRGLAGSGKTVLLAMKAAKLHKRFPDKKIAFVFYTKSLYNQAVSLIRRFYNQLTDDEPNWENLQVLHSWGGQSVGNGFYYSICKQTGVVPKTLRQGRFAEHCKELVESDGVREMFDFILIDEAQDFPLEFFLLVEKVAKAPKKVVVAYDELQTTNDILIPEFEELFGQTDGVPNITLDPKHDYILKKSYRNTLDVLITAFSFGFGFYKEITQIIQDKTTWEALGFETDSVLEAGEEVVIHRPKENSPNSITSIYPSVDPVQFSICDNDEIVAHDVATEINRLIKEQNVKPTDILVIDIKMNRSDMLYLIQSELMSMSIESHIPGVVTDAREFFHDNKVTLSTPRNAKGNEVPVVFVVGCEDIYSKHDDFQKRQSRNFMFISITRSKGWVHLFASGRVKTAFQKEIRDIKKHCPNIKFIYPSPEEVRTLSKIDFLTKNPKAKTYDNSIVSKIKQAIASGDGEILKQLFTLDPSFERHIKDAFGRLTVDAYKTIKDDIKSFLSTWLKKGLVINPQIGGDFFANPLEISSKHWFFENERDYIDSYVESYEKNLYFCAIDDGSCFQICYKFERDRRNTYVKEASLSFLPCVTDGTYVFDYIRIDYDWQNQNYFHPTVHMHVGFSGKIRIPMNEVPKFSDFFGLVMYLYYPEKYLKLLNAHEIKHTSIKNEQGMLTKVLPISEEIRKYTYLIMPDLKSTKF